MEHLLPPAKALRPLMVQLLVLCIALVERHVWPCRAWSQGFFLRRVLMRGVNHTGHLEDNVTVFKGKHSPNSCCRPDCKQDGSNKDKVGMVKREKITLSWYMPRFPMVPEEHPSPPPPKKNLASPPNHPRGKNC